MSNKVPGQAEKWDDVIRQLTSVWTPESAARVLAAIAQLDLHGSSSEGDVLVRVGDKFIPQAPAGGSSTLMVLKKAANYTLTAADSGKLAVPTANDVVFMLPTAAAGLNYVVTMWSDLAHPVIVRPQPSEQIASIGEHTLAAGKGVMGDQWNLGNYAMQIGGVLRIVATGSGEPWLVDGVGGPGGGSAPNWTSEL